MNYVKTTLNKPLEIDDIVSVHYFEYAKDFAYSGEFHDFWELVYADKEELLITAGAHELVLKTGQLYLHSPMEFHNLRCNGEKAANSFIISFSSDSPHLYSISGTALTCPENCKKHLANIVKEAQNAFSSPLGKLHIEKLDRRSDAVFGAEQIIQLQLEEFLVRLIREYGSTVSKEQSNVEHEANSRLANICQYLENNVESKLTFGDLCQRFSMSESSLKKLFREGIGCGAIEFYNRCKIDRAKQLIREKNINFTEISDRLGYNSLQFFSRRFKQFTGMTPSQYAASIKEMV